MANVAYPQQSFRKCRVFRIFFMLKPCSICSKSNAPMRNNNKNRAMCETSIWRNLYSLLKKDILKQCGKQGLKQSFNWTDWFKVLPKEILPKEITNKTQPI